MTLSLPYVINDPAVQGNFDALALQFPVNEGGLGTYKQLFHATANLAATPLGTYIFGPSTTFAAASGAAGSASALFYFNPANFNWSSRTTRLALRLTFAANAVASTVNFTLNMNVVSGTTGGAGVAAGISAGLGVSGAAASLVAPPAGAVTTAVSADFAAPVAGPYCLTIVISGAMAAGSTASVIGDLLLRQT